MDNNQKIATCKICFEEKLSVNACIYKKETKCSKPHHFCQDCTANHILHKIQAGSAIIRCPGVECNAIIDPIGCQSLITRNSFVGWCDIMANNWAYREGYRQGVSPYDGCAEVVIDECTGGGRQECPRCKRVFCFDCGMIWSINHHEACRFDESVFLNAARQGKWKRCPNCRFFVQRSLGCDKVKCRCGTRFCLNCGVEGCSISGHYTPPIPYMDHDWAPVVFLVGLLLVIAIILFILKIVLHMDGIL